MANRYKIPVPLFSSDGVTQEAICQPPVGGGLSSEVDFSGKSGRSLKQNYNEERRLRKKKLANARLPRKATKLQLIAPVP